MDIHEYQAKALLAGFGVSVPQGGVAYSPEQAVFVATEIGGWHWAVKAQIHAGGRGKSGGVKLCRTYQEIAAAAKAMLGTTLVTHQTGPAGKVVHRVYVEKAEPYMRALYLGFVLDRKVERIRVIASAEGGMEIEEIAQQKPDTLLQQQVDPAVGLQAFQARELAFGLGLNLKQVNQAVTTIMGCYRAFRDLDATMVEINPLVVTKDNRVLALDAKMSFDDNALFRRPKISEMRDPAEEDPREAQAAEFGLNYVGLTGQIGCIINGAGHDQVRGGRAREFPRRRRRRISRAGRGGVQSRALGPERQGHSRQHLRRYQSMRLGRAGRRPGRQGLARSLGRPIGRYQRGGGQTARSRQRLADHHRRHARRSGAKGGRRCLRGGVMSILIDADTPVIVQGFTGDKASFHAREMISYGTKVVGGVTPGKGGQTHLDRPVFNTVKEAVHATGAEASLAFVPPPFAADALMEAADAGLKLVCIITDGIPAQDMMRVKRYLRRYPKPKRTTVVGPNCAGIISAGKAMLGIMPSNIYLRGNVGVVSRSGTLGYEAGAQMKELGIGITTSVGIGGDPINGSSFLDHLMLFERDPETKAVIMIGEIGGPQEAEAAKWVRENMSKPVVGYVAGLTAPKGRRMGHAGAIISAEGDTAAEKAEIMRSYGLYVAPSPAELGRTVALALSKA